MDDFTCSIDDIPLVLEEAILEPFVQEKKAEMARGIDKTMDEMVIETKANAPTDGGKWAAGSDYAKDHMPFPKKSRAGGTFAKHITSKSEDFFQGHSATWYVKAPEYRLTHLLAHGHEHFIFGKPRGKRAEGDPFLHNARDNAEKNLVPNIIKEIENS